MSIPGNLIDDREQHDAGGARVQLRLTSDESCHLLNLLQRESPAGTQITGTMLKKRASQCYFIVGKKENDCSGGGAAKSDAQGGPQP